MNKGRPKIIRPIELLTFTTYLEDITLFRNYLIDSLELDDEEDETDNEFNKETIRKFLNMDIWRLNIFIVYILNQKSLFSFRALAELLLVDRNDLRHEINNIKKELKTV